MRPKIIRISPYAATDPNGISTSQTPAAGGNQELTITGVMASGGVATLDVARQVLLTFGSDDSARKFIVSGGDAKGNFMQEAIAGSATTSQTVRAFTTVTSILVDADTAGTVQAGTATVIMSNWVPVDKWKIDFQLSMLFDAAAATATVDCTVELTPSNILRQQGNAAEKPRILSEFDRTFPSHTVFNHSTMINMSTDSTGNLDFPVTAVRLKSNSVFITDTVSLEIIQGGLI